MKKQHVLFVCVHNSGRSQMAEAFVNHLSGAVVAQSAGTIPGGAVNPVAVQAMREKGIDMSAHHPKLLTPDMLAWASRVITMGCMVEDACPAVYVQAEDWGLEDPSGKPLETVRGIRDEIEVRVHRLLSSFDASLKGARCVGA